MEYKIRTIPLMMPFRLGLVNCYLIETETGFILVDSGVSNRCAELEGVLEKAGCVPGNLKLIVLTHGDFDHTGNAAYLRGQYGAVIGMHVDDLGAVEEGDMFFNRKRPNVIVRKLVPALFGFGKAKRFRPDLLLDEDFDFAPYGLDAKVVYIPGHSKGSIGIVTGRGDFFCGDLLEKSKDGAGLGSIIDDELAAQSSLEKLKGYDIRMVYSGHSEPFLMEEVGVEAV